MSVLVIYVPDAAVVDGASGPHRIDGLEYSLQAASGLGEISVLYAARQENEAGFGRIVRDCCVSYQVSRLLHMELDDEALAPEYVADFVVAYFRENRDIDNILLQDTIIGTNIAAYIGVALDLGVVTQIQALDRDGNACKTVLGGSSTIEVTMKSTPKVVTVAASCAPENKEMIKFSEPACAALPQTDGSELRELRVAAVSSFDKVSVVTRTQRQLKNNRPSLHDAKIVIAGGRGVGRDWTVLEELADAFDGQQGGAAIGATKAAVDLGWVGHEMQIGQTGVIVSPNLYISAGISGAQQQKSGMQTSRTILAVNTDRDAVVFEIADFGIVGDVHQVLPALTAEIKRRGL